LISKGNVKTSLEAVKSSLEYLVNGAGDGYFKANPAVRDMIGQDEPWHGSQRGVVSQGIGNALFESCDLAGLERVQLPAEFMAAGIALMVKPANWLLASHWVGALHSNMVLANEEESLFDPVHPSQLFALVLSVGDHFQKGNFLARWHKRFDERVDNVKLVKGKK
jgi:hypothetical protein